MNQVLFLNQIIHSCCLDILKDMPDEFFELAIVDPPYGIDYVSCAALKSGAKPGSSRAFKGVYEKKDWDKERPTEDYFKELFRVSKNQIIWGGNYFTNYLPPSQGWIFWDKNNGQSDFSDGELAFTSFNKALRKFKVTWNGMLQEDMKRKEKRIHPTQKPVQLYEILLRNYAKPGWKILDTHSGSGSCAVACQNLGFDFLAIERDFEDFKSSSQRLEQARRVKKYRLV